MRFPGPLLLAVFLRVLLEMIPRRSALRVIGIDINLGSKFSLKPFLFLSRAIKGYSKNSGTEEIINRVEKIAKAKGISMAQLSLAWIMSRKGMLSFLLLTLLLLQVNLIKFKVYRHPLLERPLLKTYMISWV